MSATDATPHRSTGSPDDAAPLAIRGAAPRIAVIGAGIVGAACAWELADAGCEVTVLERAAMPATESTARSAAGLRHQFSHPVNVAMSQFSRVAFERFERVHGVDAGFRRVGYLFLVPAAEATTWRSLQGTWSELGVAVRALEPDALRRTFPWIDARDVAFGSLGRDDGVLDPHAVTLGYLGSARRLGSEVVTGAEVVDLTPTSDGWQVETRVGDASRRFAVDAVVNAAGPWAAHIGAMAGLELPVAPTRRCVYATEPLPAFGHHPTPLTIDLASGVYVRSEGERLIFGASNPDEPPGYSLAVDWAWLETVLEAALPRVPALAEAGLDRSACWAGLYSITPDGMPILGVPEGRPGFCNAVGFSGHGVQHAPATGRIVREALLADRVSSFDVSPFRLERFEGRDASRDVGARPERAIV